MNALIERVDAPVNEGIVPQAGSASSNASNEVEADACENAVVNDEIHDGEATADLRSSQLPPNLPSTASVKSADEPTLGSPQELSEASERNKDDKLKSTLDGITVFLDVLEGVADFVPVAGIVSAVSIVRLIVGHLHVSILSP
jgi:hypothetical protein